MFLLLYFRKEELFYQSPQKCLDQMYLKFGSFLIGNELLLFSLLNFLFTLLYFNFFIRILFFYFLLFWLFLSRFSNFLNYRILDINYSAHNLHHGLTFWIIVAA